MSHLYLKEKICGSKQITNISEIRSCWNSPIWWYRWVWLGVQRRGEVKRNHIHSHWNYPESVLEESLQHQHRPGSTPGLYSACPCPAQGWQHCLCLYCSTEGMPGLIHMEGWERNWTGRSRSGIGSHRSFRGPPDRVKQPVLRHSWITESLQCQGLHTCPPLSLWV